MFFGCGTDENIFKPEATETPAVYTSAGTDGNNFRSQLESEASFLAAPKNDKGGNNKGGKSEKTAEPVSSEITVKPVARNKVLNAQEDDCSLHYSAKATFGPNGGTLTINHNDITVTSKTKIIIPQDALTNNVRISADITSDKVSRVDFHFEPHGTVFAKPVEIELSWAMLQDGTLKPQDLILYYYDESVEDWVEETTACWKRQDKVAVIYVNHFSLYYFRRR